MIDRDMLFQFQPLFMYCSRLYLVDKRSPLLHSPSLTSLSPHQNQPRQQCAFYVSQDYIAPRPYAHKRRLTGLIPVY